MINKDKFLSLIAFTIAVAVVVIGINAIRGKTAIGGAMVTSECTVSTVANSAVGNELTTTLLAAYSNRAWARIQVADGEVEPIFVSFDEGAAATVDNGLALTATSTTYIDFGLNTEFPYTGAVTGITGTASTTVLITECRF